MGENTVSIRICQEGHANALALNRDCTQIAVAGRSLLKVFSIESDGFTEVCNMRGGKNQNLSYSSNDVAWNFLDNNILATAATNGVVSVWDLSRFGRQKQLLVYSQHERTAHTVTFHNTESNLLISGSQDGTIKCFDMRVDKVAINTYYSNSESVRDVKFCPHAPNTFAAVSENGTIQLWDIRKPDKCLQHFTAHSGPIYTCDWHPNQQWLATGSRDKQIKIWNMGFKPTLEYTIHTIAVVGRVKWRPDEMYHIASCALVVDYSIYIWDVRRPYIPFASFNDHTNVTTGIGWKGTDSNILLSTSKDSTIFKHAFKDAARPSSRANPQCANINYKGDLLYSYKIKDKQQTVNNSKLSVFQKQQQTQVIENFHIAKSILHTYTQKKSVNDKYNIGNNNTNKTVLSRDFLIFKGCAKEYKLHGENLADICEHNSKVARKYSRHNVALLWQLVKELYSNNNTNLNAINTSKQKLTVQASVSATSDTRNINSNQNLLLQQNVNQIQIGARSSGGCSTVAGISSVNTIVDDIMGSGNKNEEGLVLNGLNTSDDINKFKDNKIGDIKYQSVNHHPQYNFNDCNETTINDIVFDDTVLTVDNMEWVKNLRNGFLYTGPHDLSKCGLSLPNSSLIGHDLHTTRQQEVSSSVNDHLQEMSPPPDPPNIIIKVATQPSPPMWEPHKFLADSLMLQTECGDIQTCVSILIVLGDRRCEIPIDETLHENWLMSYVDLLQRHKLWNEATEIINLSWIRNVGEINQQSTGVHKNCGNCSRPLLSSYCYKCKSSDSSKCSVCNLVVRGLYAWCQGCSHGGHLDHMQQWFANNSKCPKCGHLCEYE